MRFPFKRTLTFVPEVLGHYELNAFPGNNQIVVSTHSYIRDEYRGRGFGQMLSEEKIEKAKELDYDYMVATVIGANAPQMRIMENNGWKLLDTFQNKVTGNEVNLFGRSLNG